MSTRCGRRLPASRGTLFVAASLLATPALPAESAGQQAPFRYDGPAFVALMVPEVDGAAEWYGRVFGAEVTNALASPDGRFSIRILRNESLTFELIQLEGATAPPDNPLGLFKAGFYVDDIEAAFGWFRSHGSDTDAGIFTDDALVVRSFVMRDPWGNRLQFFQRCGDSC